jgi:hypothetical protein
MPQWANAEIPVVTLYRLLPMYHVCIKIRMKFLAPDCLLLSLQIPGSYVESVGDTCIFILFHVVLWTVPHTFIFSTSTF